MGIMKNIKQKLVDNMIEKQGKAALDRLNKWVQSDDYPGMSEINLYYDFAGDDNVVLLNYANPYQGNDRRLMSARYDGYIVVSEQWAKDLATENALKTGHEVENAYKYMLGHEHTHHINDYEYPLVGIPANQKFCQWANEIHADINGCKLAFGDDHEAAVAAVKWMCDKADPNGVTVKDTLTHPSWQHRLDYVTAGVFDADTIRKIAQDAGCTKQKLIDKVCRHYAGKEIQIVPEKAKAKEENSNHAVLEKSRSEKMTMDHVQHIVADTKQEYPKQQETEHNQHLRDKQTGRR